VEITALGPGQGRLLVQQQKPRGSDKTTRQQNWFGRKSGGRHVKKKEKNRYEKQPKGERQTKRPTQKMQRGGTKNALRRKGLIRPGTFKKWRVETKAGRGGSVGGAIRNTLKDRRERKKKKEGGGRNEATRP